MKLIDRMVEYFTGLNKKMKRWQRVVSILSAIVVFATTYMLVMPAITLDVDTASTQAGIEVASENEPDTAGTVFESTEEEEPEEPEAEPAEEEETTGSVSSAQEEEAEPASEQEEAVESDSEQEEAVESASEEQEEESAESTSDEQEEVAEEPQTGSSETEAAQSGSGSTDSVAEDSAEAASAQEAADAAKTTAETAKTAVTEDTPLIKEKTQLTYKGSDYTVYADFDESAKLPVGVELRVKEITKDSDPDAYDTYYKKALEELKDKYDENTGLSFAKFYDIAFVYNGQEIEPQGNVAIKIEYKKAVEIEEETKIDTIHFDKEDEDKVEIIDSEKEVTDKTKVESVEFESDKFSVYGVIGAETFTEKYLTEDGETYNISVTAGPEAHIPSDAHLEVSEVKAGSDKYNELFKKAEAAVTEGKDASVPFARFFDISIVKDGEKIQPDAPVEVKITFDETVEADKHAVFNAVHISGNKTDVIDVTTEGTESEKAVTVDAVQFSADGFSIYGVTYTVDFEYTDPITGKTYYFSLNGEDSINLTDLLVALGIKGEDEVEQFVAEEVVNVEFSDPELVKVTHKRKTIGVIGTDDWLLESLAPFTSEETLVISLKNGGKIVVRVTDSQSADITGQLIDATISGTGASSSGDNWTIQDPSGSYSIGLSFKENAYNPFPRMAATEDELKLTYSLPEGLIVDAQSGFVSFKNEALGIEMQIPWALTSDGKISFTLDNTESSYSDQQGHQYTAYEVFDDVTTGEINFNFTGKWDGTTEKLHFSSTVEKNVEIGTPEPGKIELSKDGWFDYGKRQLHYRFIVKAVDGEVDAATVTDTLTNATGITIDRSSVTITHNEWVHDDSSHTETINDQGMVVNFFNLSSGKEYYIDYFADIDYQLLDTDNDGKVSLSPNNKVTDGNTTKEKDVVIDNYIYTNVNKNVGTQSDIIQVGDKYYRELEWTINVNDSKIADLKNTILKDTIKTQTPPMTYWGEGLTVTRTDTSGNTTTQIVPWENLLAYDAASGWTYQFPSTTDKAAYVFTYKTRVDVTDLKDIATVKNEAEGEYGTSGKEAKVEPDELYGIEKEFVRIEDENAVWKITLTVPPDGLDNAYVEDRVPRHNNYIDKLVSYTVDGLVSGETITENWKNDSGFGLDFYYNGAKGLKGTGEERTIEITVITKLDQEWINDSNAPAMHTNYARLNSLEVSASKSFSKKSIKKVGKVVDDPKTVVYQNQKYYCFEYWIEMQGVDGAPLTLSDSMNIDGVIYWSTKARPDTQWNNWDANLSVYYSEYSSPNRWNSTECGTAALVQDGSSATFTITEESLQKKPNGEYYPYYQLQYYVLVPEDRMQEMAAQSEGLEWNLENEIDWDGNKSTSDYKVSYKGIDKELINESSLGGSERIGHFRITVNPKGATVNGGEAYKLEDTFSDSLAVDYSSFVFSDPDAILSYSISGNTITIWIEDSKPVTIDYNAKVLGEGSIPISNTAETDWGDDDINTTKEFHGDSSGGGDSVHLTLLKVDNDNAKIRLPGVKFVLHSSEPRFEVELNRYPIAARTFETTSDGTVEIKAPKDSYQIYFNVGYYLVEVPESVPEGYSVLSYDPSFIIDENGITDWSIHQYYNGYVMQVKNEKKKGNLEVTKTVVSDEEDDKTKEYSFEVRFYKDDTNTVIDEDLNGVYGDVALSAGIGTFTLKDGEKVLINGVPEGRYYVVKEIGVPEGMSVLYDGTVSEEATGSIVYNETKSVPVTNKRGPVTGSLKITKVVETDGGGAIGTLADGTYTFAIKDSDGNNAVGKVNGTDIHNGQVTITIVNGQSNTVEVTDLNAGEYTITEISGDNKAVTLDTAPKTVTVIAGKSGDDVDPTTGIASFTNRYEKTSVSVKKVWEGTANRPGSITVELIADGEDTGKSVELTSADNWAAKEISDLPKYNAVTGQEIHYTWHEGHITGYLLTEVTVDENRVTTLTNSETKYDLKTSYIGTKVWSDSDNKYNTRPDNLTIVLQRSQMDSSGRYGAFTDTSIPFTWVEPKEGNTWTYKFDNIPVYDENGNPYHYQAKETVPGNYVLDPEEPVIVPTVYQRGQLEPLGRIESNSTVEKDINQNTEIDLVYVAIKLTENAGTLIWTHRTPTQWEREQLSSQYGNSIWASGNGTVIAGKGSVTFEYSQSNMNVHLNLHATKQWALLWYGHFSGTDYSSGSTTFTNKLTTTELSGKKVWSISGDETPANPILTLTRTVTTTAEGGTETTSEPEIVMNQDGNALQPDEWTGTGKERTFKYKDLPAKDSNGNPYTYSVVEYQFTVDGITYTVTQNADGTFTATPSDASAPEILVTQENNDISNTEVTDFEVTKIWKDQSGQNVEWVKDITVILHKKSGSNETTYTYTVKEETSPGGAKTYTAASTDTDAPSAVVTGNARDGYTIKWSRLPIGFEYSATETKVDGYKDPIYAIKATDSDDGFINTENGTVLTNAGNGRYIINKPDDAVTLPESGGPGTALFYGIGIALVAMAGLLLFIKRRNIKNLSERRW